MDQSIVLEGLTRRYGDVLAVDRVSATIRPGRVTGFLGPNGAGKTTVLRMLLGLVEPTAGRALIGGRAYHEIADPLTVVGAALEATGFHPGRTARAHLSVLAPAARVGAARVGEVLETVGLTDAADRRVGGFSLGMKQRLSLAAALLGDPQMLVLDEPANGLDPEGMAWLRTFLRVFAGSGRTVLVSSHVLSEVEQTVDDVLLISRGRVVFAGELHELGPQGPGATLVRTPDPDALLVALLGAGLDAHRQPDRPDQLVVRGADAARVGAIAHGASVVVTDLRPKEHSLESVFLQLVTDGGAGVGGGRA
ncbi:ATP-binding cassette domain-containing protein [uncultured Cellulomonas sp.]|uniref:ATP-binding cassette domain-containing protein n=1 Tax=uncultured Cellulomonas sp. TaxID=189682 RepID=UPI0028EBD9DD|nr:ATP-binding cassette domain-containing protein [uncultured Cellulomonas sp.]